MIHKETEELTDRLRQILVYPENILFGECNTILQAYTMYKHLG